MGQRKEPFGGGAPQIGQVILGSTRVCKLELRTKVSQAKQSPGKGKHQGGQSGGQSTSGEKKRHWEKRGKRDRKSQKSPGRKPSSHIADAQSRKMDTHGKQKFPFNAKAKKTSGVGLWVGATSFHKGGEIEGHGTSKQKSRKESQPLVREVPKATTNTSAEKKNERGGPKK